MIKSKNHVLNYFGQISKLSNKINKKKIEKLATSLANIRKKRGRVFFIGVGGNGKSIWVDLINLVLGNYADKINIALLIQKFKL